MSHPIVRFDWGQVLMVFTDDVMTVIVVKSDWLLASLISWPRLQTLHRRPPPIPLFHPSRRPNIFQPDITIHKDFLEKCRVHSWTNQQICVGWWMVLCEPVGRSNPGNWCTCCMFSTWVAHWRGIFSSITLSDLVLTLVNEFRVLHHPRFALMATITPPTTRTTPDSTRGKCWNQSNPTNATFRPVMQQTVPVFPIFESETSADGLSVFYCRSHLCSIAVLFSLGVSLPSSDRSDTYSPGLCCQAGWLANLQNPWIVS